jgi:hypothetical protein
LSFAGANPMLSVFAITDEEKAVFSFTVSFTPSFLQEAANKKSGPMRKNSLRI